MVETVTGPQVAYVNPPVPVQNLNLVTSYNHIDLNKNNYYGDLDVTDMDRVIPYDVKYSYAEFIEGQLIYASGNRSQLVKMNYNKLYGEMQFIDENRDTLLITSVDTISYIRLDKYLYQQQYYFLENHFFLK